MLGDYDETVGDIRKNIKDFRRENPELALGLEIGGGLLTGGLGAARAAGSALGREAIRRFGTTGFGAGLGATEGAIAGVGAGEDAALPLWAPRPPLGRLEGTDGVPVAVLNTLRWLEPLGLAGDEDADGSPAR